MKSRKDIKDKRKEERKSKDLFFDLTSLLSFKTELKQNRIGNRTKESGS